MKTTVELIQSYKNMYDDGTLTLDEFTYLKDELISQGDHVFQDDDVDDIMKTSAQIKSETRADYRDFLGKMIAVIVVVVIIGAVISACSWLLDVFQEAGSSGHDYETYYEDDNGNGKLDRGEWNYTQDEDGNIVDIDNDRSNFE